jgi:hypothetical protein|tara:strand:- start:3002 stop:3211 length:210 start_codon:yes stop_codon:yes gene_type:complete
MNLYDIIMEVLEHADESKMTLDDEMSRQSIATEVYDLFYENQVYSPYVENGYIDNLQEYWHFREDLDEE